MAMITLNLIMTYRCKNHPSCELEVFQPANGLCYVTPCIECVTDQIRTNQTQNQKEGFYTKRNQ